MSVSFLRESPLFLTETIFGLLSPPEDPIHMEHSFLSSAFRLAARARIALRGIRPAWRSYRAAKLRLPSLDSSSPRDLLDPLRGRRLAQTAKARSRRPRSGSRRSQASTCRAASVAARHQARFMPHVPRPRTPWCRWRRQRRHGRSTVGLLRPSSACDKRLRGASELCLQLRFHQRKDTCMRRCFHPFPRLSPPVSLCVVAQVSIDRGNFLAQQW